MSGDSPELAARSQALPTGNGIDVAIEVAEDMKRMGYQQIAEDIEARIRMGEKKYGSRLKSNNGRDAVLDLYQEVLDAMNYAKQMEIEKLDTNGDFFRHLVDIAIRVEAKLKR